MALAAVAAVMAFEPVAVVAEALAPVTEAWTLLGVYRFAEDMAAALAPCIDLRPPHLAVE